MGSDGGTPHFVLTLWTADPDLARRADHAGVDRVGLDLEILGKRARQHEALGTWITKHTCDQLPAIRRALTHASLFARTNPLHAGLGREVDQLLDAGVSVLMFPNFQDLSELKAFLRMVGGRAKVVPLLERLAAAKQIDQIVALGEIDEIHVGMNDLALDLGLKNRMEVLISPTLAHIASTVAKATKRLGVGGVARAYDATLPVPSELVYAQYPRLRATAALISRSFSPQKLSAAEFAAQIDGLRTRMRYWFTRSPEEIESSSRELEAHLARGAGGLV